MIIYGKQAGKIIEGSAMFAPMLREAFEMLSWAIRIRKRMH